MGLPSGTFNSASSGKLQVSFGGTWTQTSGADWGGPSGLALYLRGIVDDGTIRKTIVLGFESPSGTIELDYVGGTDVDVSMEHIAHEFDGPSTVRAQNLLIRCYLIKR